MSSIAISLRNFRTHRDKKIVLPGDNGLFLFSGESGTGKSTIFEAFAYALYGSDVVTKPYSHGTRTCEVSVDFPELFVKRTSSPNTLCVIVKQKGSKGTPFEGEEAQTCIDKFMGMKWDEFSLSSYIKQGIESSILSLTPAKQMEYIESIALTSGIHKKYKEVIKKRIAERKTELVGLESEINLLDRQLIEEQDEQKDEQKIDISSLPNADELSAELVSLKEELKTQKVYLSHLQDHLVEEEKKEQKSNESEETRNALVSDIKQLKKSLSSFDELKMTQRISELDVELDICESLALFLGFKKKKDKFEKTKKDYFDEIESKKKECEKSIIENVDEIRSQKQELLKKVKKRDEHFQFVKGVIEEVKEEFELEQMNTSIKKLVSFLDLKEQENDTEIASNLKKLVNAYAKDITQKKLKCPECDHSLSLVVSHDDTCLVKYSKKKTDETKEVSIGKIVKKLNVLFQRRHKVKHWNKSVGDIKDELVELIQSTKGLQEKDLEKELEDLVAASQLSNVKKEKKKEYVAILKSRKLPLSIQQIQDELNREEEKYKDHDKKVKNPEKYDFAKISEEIRDIKYKLARYQQDKQLLIDKEQELQSMTVSQSKLKMSKSLQDVIMWTRVFINGLQDEIRNVESQKDYVSRYQDIVAKRKKLVKKQEQLEKLKETRKKYTVEVESFLVLERLLKQAESEAVEETLEAINNFAKLYLDEMFSDPILVRLSSEKESKKGDKKVQMNTYVQYKGSVYDKVTSLSGGEYQRVNLAFILAINELLGSRFLLLDECTNNLDAGTSIDIFTKLRDVCGKTKQIFVISHEEISGVFDEVINL